MADRLPANLDAILGEFPSGAAAIGVVRSARLPHWAAEQAVSLANAAGNRGGRTLLLNGEVSPSDAALTGEGQGFIYFPAGAAPADPTTLTNLPALGNLIHRMMTHGAIVLLYMPEDAVTSELSDQVDAWVLLGCEAPERAATVPALGRVRGPRKDVPGPDESVTMAADRVETLSAGPAPMAALSDHRHRGHPPRRRGSRSPDTLPALLFVYLLFAAFAVTLWLLDPSASTDTPDAPDAIAEAPGQTQPLDSAAADSLSEPTRPYSTLTGSGALWTGMDETLRKLDSLFNDSTTTAARRR
jgi:hypothetical protein